MVKQFKVSLEYLPGCNSRGCVHIIITTALMMLSSLVPALRAMADQESKDGLYQKWQMFLAYIFHILPFSIISVFIFSSFLYWCVSVSE